MQRAEFGTPCHLGVGCVRSAQSIVEKSGAWYSYKGSRIGQGKDNARTFLQQNKEIAREIEEQIRAKLLPVKQPRNGAADQADSA